MDDYQLPAWNPLHWSTAKRNTIGVAGLAVTAAGGVWFWRMAHGRCESRNLDGPLVVMMAGLVAILAAAVDPLSGLREGDDE